MLVVAVIAVLAVLAIPSFFSTSRKAKAESEVAAIFAELRMREEQYKGDSSNGSYLAATACPTTTTQAGKPLTDCTDAGKPWAALRALPGLQTLRCKYTIVTGNTTGTDNPDGFVFTSPAANWYYILAECDTDGVTTTNSKYFTSSVNSEIQKKDVGK